VKLALHMYCTREAVVEYVMLIPHTEHSVRLYFFPHFFEQPYILLFTFFFSKTSFPYLN